LFLAALSTPFDNLLHAKRIVGESCHGVNKIKQAFIYSLIMLLHNYPFHHSYHQVFVCIHKNKIKPVSNINKTKVQFSNNARATKGFDIHMLDYQRNYILEFSKHTYAYTHLFVVYTSYPVQVSMSTI
jgi:hypothetical protein